MSQNFPGNTAFDAKEARLIVDLCRQKDFKSLVSYHSYGNLMYWGFFSSGSFRSRCQEIANAMKKSNGYRLVADTPTPSNYSHLGLKDWFMKEYKRPGFTIETGGKETPLEIDEIKKVIDKNIEIPAVMLYYEYSAQVEIEAPEQNSSLLPQRTEAPADTALPPTKEPEQTAA